MPNSTIARDSVIGLVQSQRMHREPGHGGYVSVAPERGASGLVAEKIGQSIRCFTLRIRLRAFVADQKFCDGSRHVVHPTDLERGDRETNRWSDASTRDENSHAGVKSKAQANARTSICRQCPWRPTAIQMRRLGQRDRAARSTFENAKFEQHFGPKFPRVVNEKPSPELLNCDLETRMRNGTERCLNCGGLLPLPEVVRPGRPPEVPLNPVPKASIVSVAAG